MPALSGYNAKHIDLSSRHFANINTTDDYQRFIKERPMLILEDASQVVLSSPRQLAEPLRRKQNGSQVDLSDN